MGRIWAVTCHDLWVVVVGVTMVVVVAVVNFVGSRRRRGWRRRERGQRLL